MLTDSDRNRCAVSWIC